MKKFNKQKGITLVALVVTIVILLILAGVSLNLVLGENGIVRKANEGRANWTNASAEEQATLDSLEEEIMGYMGEIIPGTAADIASNAVENYGKYVTNYTAGWQYIKGVTEETKDTSWKIFYADANNIYLIASNYISYEGMPTVEVNGEIKTLQVTYEEDGETKIYPYRGNFSNVKAGYSTGSAAIASNMQYLNKNYFEYLTSTDQTSSYNNIQSVAYMLDTSKWNTNYKTEKAEWAIGGPSLELLFASYNSKYPTSKLVVGSVSENTETTETINLNGYQYSTNGGTSWTTVDSALINNDSLYRIGSSANDDPSCCWLSSPSAAHPDGIIDYSNDSVAYNGYSEIRHGFRPVVRLSSDVKLEPDPASAGNYRIVD